MREESKEQRIKLIETLKNFLLGDEQLDKEFNMNANLSPKQKRMIMTLICNNSNNFI